MKVFKLKGEAYEITEYQEVYTTREKALKAAEKWCDGFLDMTLEEALEDEEIIIEEWDLV